MSNKENSRKLKIARINATLSTLTGKNNMNKLRNGKSAKKIGFWISSTKVYINFAW